MTRNRVLLALLDALDQPVGGAHLFLQILARLFFFAAPSCPSEAAVER